MNIHILAKGTEFSWLGENYVVQKVRLGHAKPVLAYAEESRHQTFAFTSEQMKDAIITKKTTNG